MYATLLEQTDIPLSREKAELLDKLVQGLRPDELHWISGYLAGIGVATRPAANAPSGRPQSDPAPEITIVYGSQTGHGEAIAELARQRALGRGFRVRVEEMADVTRAQLPMTRYLMAVVSTHGDGEPPDNARELHALLCGGKAPGLPEMQFAVLALGDSSYERFCQTGRDFDARLESLGARRIHPRVDCDVDYEQDAEQWIDAVLSAFANASHPHSARVTTLHPAGAPAVVEYSRKNPFPATVIDNITLNGRGSSKEVRHIELSLDGSGLGYEPGDALAVMPRNGAATVDVLIEALGLDPAAAIAGEEGETALAEVLASRYEITTLSRPFLTGYAELAGSRTLQALLEEDGRADLRAYLAGRHIIDVVTDFPVAGIAAAQFLALLRKLPPRLYSIASSHQASPREVHLTVAAVRYQAWGRQREGVASIHLAERLAEGDTVPVYVEANKHFRLPADSGTPIIMVGAGTGVAPFRAFMAQREHSGAEGRNWLFFGDRQFRVDFLYQREWLRYRKAGLLSRIDVAWSRDGAEKRYVQDRMRERSRDLFAWLEEGAHLYVCGDAERMARDVHATLLDIVRQEGAMPPDAAAAYVERLRQDRRYQRDVY